MKINNKMMESNDFNNYIHNIKYIIINQKYTMLISKISAASDYNSTLIFIPFSLKIFIGNNKQFVYLF